MWYGGGGSAVTGRVVWCGLTALEPNPHIPTAAEEEAAAAAGTCAHTICARLAALESGGKYHKYVELVSSLLLVRVRDPDKDGVVSRQWRQLVVTANVFAVKYCEEAKCVASMALLARGVWWLCFLFPVASRADAAWLTFRLHPPPPPSSPLPVAHVAHAVVPRGHRCVCACADAQIWSRVGHASRRHEPGDRGHCTGRSYTWQFEGVHSRQLRVLLLPPWQDVRSPASSEEGHSSPCCPEAVGPRCQVPLAHRGDS